MIHGDPNQITKFSRYNAGFKVPDGRCDTSSKLLFFMDSLALFLDAVSGLVFGSSLRHCFSHSHTS